MRAVHPVAQVGFYGQPPEGSRVQDTPANIHAGRETHADAKGADEAGKRPHCQEPHVALENDLTRARLNAAAARRDGNRDMATYWTEMAEHYEHRLTLRDNPWDELKGSPEHDGWARG